MATAGVRKRKQKKLEKSQRASSLKKKSHPSEKDIQKKILAYLRSKRVLHCRINSGFIYSKGYMIRLAPVGFPDVVVFRSGTTTGVEVKKKGRVVDSPQLEWCHSLRSQGMEYIVVYSVDQVKQWLTETR